MQFGDSASAYFHYPGRIAEKPDNILEFCVGESTSGAVEGQKIPGGKESNPCGNFIPEENIKAAAALQPMHKNHGYKGGKRHAASLTQ